MSVQAQRLRVGEHSSGMRLNHDFKGESLSEALIWIDNAQSDYKLNFIFDELEAFTVTTQLKNVSVRDAVRQVCGFYPMHLMFDRQDIYIECMQKSETKLSGRIIDKDDQPIAYASVSLFSLGDSVFITGGVSNEAGDFVIPCTAQSVIARITCIGYKTIERLFRVGYIGAIKMSPDSYTLNGVTVKGSVPQYQKGDEGLITNVEHTVLSKLGTGEDVLAHVPGLTKKQEGFEVFGKGSPLIYINGRQMRDASELDQLKSEDIKSVELVTNPGAKYDASVKAVVKIRTKMIHGDGFGFDARSSYFQSENTDFMDQLNWNYRHNSLDVFGMFRWSQANTHYESNTTTLVEADTLWQQEFHQEIKHTRRVFTSDIGTNYSIDSDNSVGFKYTLQLRPDMNFSPYSVSEVTANGQSYDRLENNVDRRQAYRPNHLLNVYYSGKIGKARIDFNTDYLRNQNSDRVIYDERSRDRQDRIVHSANTERNQLLASKLTVDYPLLGGNLTIGAEYTHTMRNDDYSNIEGYVPTSLAELKESHIAPFAEYSRQIAILRLAAGLRYEWVDFDYYENGLHLDEQSRTFNNLFPSLSLVTKLGQLQLQLGYTNKTSRPTYKQLSNNVTYGNRFLMQSGNPFLNQERIHDLSLIGVWKYLQFNVCYTDHRDAIVYWSEQQASSSAVSRISYQNLPTIKSVSAQMAVSKKVGVWSPQVSIAVQKQWLTLHTNVRDYKLNTPTWQFNLDNAFDFGHGWIASADAYLTTKGGDYMNGSQPYNDASVIISLTKSLLNDRLSIRLQGNDLFHTERQGGLIYSGSLQTKQIGKRDSREIGITVRYKFNTTRSKYKGTGAGNAEKNRL